MRAEMNEEISQNKFRIKATLLKPVQFGYQRIFHEEMSSDMMGFLQNILYVGAGTAVSTLFSLIFTILGARLLGPEEYGKFILVQSVALFLNLPMLLGFNTAMVKYSSEREDFDRRSSIIVTTYLLVLLFSVASAVLYLILASPLSNLFGMSTNLFYVATAFAALYVFYTLTTSALRGLNRMRLYSIFQVVYAGILLIIFAAFAIDRNLTFRTMAYPTLIAYFITIIIILSLVLRKYIKWKFEKSVVIMLFKYASFSAIGGLSAVLYTNVDRIMISRYLNVTDLGIYAAYYTASITVALVLYNVFNMVFFPTASRYENKGPIFKRINIFIPHLIYLGIIFIIISELIVLKLYGGQYPFNLLWMVLAAIASITIVTEGIYIWLLNSVGTKGVKVSATGAASVALLNFGLNFLLIPLIGITGGLISIIISFSIGTAIIFYFGKKYLIS